MIGQYLAKIFANYEGEKATIFLIVLEIVLLIMMALPWGWL